MQAARIGFLFPGQGAQHVGMCRGLIEDRGGPGRALFDRASEGLGYDLAAICLEGPEEKLAATEYSQPALFVSSMAAVEVLRSERPELLERVTATAGLSLGEYTAVCFAGGLDFDSAVRLVQRRGRAMQSAADRVDSGMASVLGLDAEALERVCEEVRRDGEELRVANLLCPGNIAVSGHRAALQRLEPAATAAGAMRVVPLQVAGAFHTPLMEPAVEELSAALAEMPLVETRIPVYSNVDAAAHRSADEIRELLARQVVSPVRWEASLRNMMADSVEGFMEIGAGRVLRGTLKRISRRTPAEGFGDDG